MNMKTVKQVSQVSGVSVRTLHHYDAIGLLKPTRVTEAGYRLYDEDALERLQSILLFRELQFPLKEIGRILDTPGFDRRAALNDQIHLLELQREHIDRLLSSAREMQENGGKMMSFSVFDKKQQLAFAEEAKQRWGSTDAYRESQEKTAGKSDEQLRQDGSDLMAFFAKLGQLKSGNPHGEKAQAVVAELQQFITEHYYNCTKPILSGLGQMYVADERFKANIDNAGGEGTAEFAAEAIAFYCAN